jgi:hypothetical protein
MPEKCKGYRQTLYLFDAPIFASKFDIDTYRPHLHFQICEYYEIGTLLEKESCT